MDPVRRWLLEGDAAIRWQVLRDLTDAPAEDVAAERARVGVEGWGAQLLAQQGDDGTWGGVAWNHGWDVLRVPVLVALRRAAGARVPARRRLRAR